MKKVRSWEVSDEFWARVEPLLPKREREAGREYKRKPGGGRKPLSSRRIFEGIVFVLRTGCQWKAVPKERYGAGSSIHAYFRTWEKAGVFLALWRAGLAEYDEMTGIAWEWQSVDGAMTKAPLAREGDGRNPTDRGKKRHQAKSAGGRPWRPAVARRLRRQSARRDPA